MDASSRSHALQLNSNHANYDTGPSQNFIHCFRRFMLVLVMLFLILNLVIFIAWLVIHPCDPSFQLRSFFISNLTLLDSRFVANYDVEFHVNNTNKKANLVIDHVKISVCYRKAILSERIFEQSSLYVPKRSLEKWNLSLHEESVHPIKNRVFKDISDNWSKKIVNLTVELSVRAKYQVGVWPSKNKFFRVSCLDLAVEFLSTKGAGKLASAGRDCALHLP